MYHAKQQESWKKHNTEPRGQHQQIDHEERCRSIDICSPTSMKVSPWTEKCGKRCGLILLRRLEKSKSVLSPTMSPDVAPAYGSGCRTALSSHVRPRYPMIPLKKAVARGRTNTNAVTASSAVWTMNSETGWNALRTTWYATQAISSQRAQLAPRRTKIPPTTARRRTMSTRRVSKSGGLFSSDT